MGKLQQQFANKKLKKLHDFHLTLSTQPCVKIDRRRLDKINLEACIFCLLPSICCAHFGTNFSLISLASNDQVC